MPRLALLAPTLLALAFTPFVPFSAQADDTTNPAGADSAALNSLPVVQMTGSAGRAGYREGEASGGSKISAALRDIPQSIQVLPRQLIDDQLAVRPHDLVQNVSGVFRGNAVFGDNFIFRGFSTSEFLRDGLPDRRSSIRDTANIEQVEVLKGPASVLFGRIEPGGTLNYVTKRPLAAPRYAVELKADSFGMLRPTADLSGVTADGQLGARLNLAAEHGGNFRDHSFSDRAFGSGVLVWQLSPDTQLSVEAEALNDRRLLDRGVPRFGSGPAPIPVTRLISEPDDDRVVGERLLGYTLEHQLKPGWRVKQVLRASESSNQDHRTRFLQSAAQIAGSSSWNGVVNRDLLLRDADEESLTAQLELIGELRQSNGVRHQLLVGLDLDRLKSHDDSRQANTIVAANSINIFKPIHGNFVPVGLRPSALSDSTVSTRALYVQDLIDLGTHWKALVGARYDAARNRSDNLLTAKSSGVDANALSPRAGLVWQPTRELSVYGSYSESFVPVIGQDFAGRLFDPTTGEQVELGAKSEWLGGRLLATMALFQIKKNNVSVSDPDHTGFSLQTGQVTSDGVEFDLSGSPLTGLNLMANLSLTDVRTTRDTRSSMLGKRPANTPTRGGGLWLSYELQNQVWRGWGGGFGAHHVGERQGDAAGSFFLPAYTRWDASLSYRAPAPQHWRVALKLENLADKIYYISSHDSLGIYPGAPRNAVLSASYQW
jgi:iron complex outermembrane receptor protein